MNCLEFRQTLLANPHSDEPTVTEHRKRCDKCAQFTQQLQQQEAQLQLAMAIPVPPRLAERVLLANNLRKRTWQPWATAAAITLAITIGSAALWREGHHDNASWSEIALAHVLNERGTLFSQSEVEGAKVTAALAQFGINIKNELGRVIFLEKCDMPGGKGLHMVINSPQAGLVTLIIPPLGTAAETGSSTRDGYIASITQIGKIAVGIVSDEQEALNLFREWLSAEISAA